MVNFVLLTWTQTAKLEHISLAVFVNQNSYKNRYEIKFIKEEGCGECKYTT